MLLLLQREWSQVSYCFDLIIELYFSIKSCIIILMFWKLFKIEVCWAFSEHVNCCCFYISTEWLCSIFTVHLVVLFMYLLILILFYIFALFILIMHIIDALSGCVVLLHCYFWFGNVEINKHTNKYNLMITHFVWLYFGMGK